MGATHSKQCNYKPTTGKHRTRIKSRKRSKLSGSFGRTITKQPKIDSPSTDISPLPASPSVSLPETSLTQSPLLAPSEQHSQQIVHNVLPSIPSTSTSISLPTKRASINNQDNLHSADGKDDDDNDDEITPMRNISTATNYNNIGTDIVNGRSHKRRTGNSSRSTKTPATTGTTRPLSSMSFSTDSGVQSATSSGWTFSGGLFSHIDINTSSTITAITDFSTISRRSMLDLPDDYSNRKLTSPPPYCQPSICITTGESSTSTSQPSTSTNTKVLANDPLPSVLNEKDSLLAQLIRSPSSSFRLFKDAFTTCCATIDKHDAIVSKELIFKTVELWHQQTDDTAAQMWSARCIIEGWGTQADPKLGFTRLKALADHGCWEAYYPLALYYLKGIQTANVATTTNTNPASDTSIIQPVDEVAAHQWFSATVEYEQPVGLLDQDLQAITDVIALAQYRLGSMLFYGLGIPEQPEKGLQWFEKSASLGNRHSQFITGLVYEKGTIVKQDFNKAEKFYRSSADQGFVDAQAALGIYLIDQNQVEQGVYWLKQAILMNNPRALLKLGIMHETGQGVIKDHSLATHYYKVAANQDDAVAHYVLGIHYLLGQILLKQDYHQAGKHLMRSARAGFTPSQRVIGLMYSQGLLATQQDDQQRRKDEKSALVWFRRAASHGDVRALGLVGYCYEFGRGAAVNYDIALQYYQKAARIVSPFQCPALVAVATLLHRMNRHHDALNWYTRASNFDLSHQQITLHDASTTADDSGSFKEIHRAKRAATLMVARYHLHGWTGIKRPSTAFALLSQLTLDNTTDGHAHYWMAACFEEGIFGVCNRDLYKAYHHYYTAAISGDIDAQFQVAFMLSNGKGVEKDRPEAYQWYKKAAEQGHKTALYSLGLYYVKGLDGVTMDLEKASECFKQAAQQGMVTAMVSLASLYRMTVNNIQDMPDGNPTSSYYLEQIVFWYRKAAALGDVGAQRELGIIYNAGLFGITQDHAMALDLLSKASRQEDAQATLLLASYYQHGILVERNDEQAIRLYLYAISLGSPVAHFAVAQLYHLLNQHENAYTQYQLASNHPLLQKTKIGRTSTLMVARYVLSYIADGSSSLDNTQHNTTKLGITHTKAEAFKMLETLAVVDRFESSFYWLADCYFMGNGTTTNYHDALYWFRRSADEINDKDAMFKAAQMYEKGIGTETNHTLAIQYHEMAANLGHTEGQHQMGMAFWHGFYGLAIDLNKAVQWFTKSATHRYGESHWALGQMAYENEDYEMAAAWWQKAVDIGHVISMRLLGMLILHHPLPSSSKTPAANLDIGHALQLLTDASQLGDVESLVLLGQVHQAGMVTSLFQSTLSNHQQSEASCDSQQGETSILNSDGEEELVMNEEEAQVLQRQQEEQELAIRCFEQAASLGHVGAMFLAGQYWHTQQQYAAAFEFYDQAAQCGHTLSRVMRARYQLAGLGGITIQKECGFKELLDCAEKDDCVEAYNSLGQCYEMGLGTEVDTTRAYQWYLRSSETTADSEAMYRIGQLYNEGRLDCPEANTEAAFRWYQLADEASGHVRANYQLGLYYLGTESAGQQQTPRNAMQIPHSNKALAMTHFQNAATRGDNDSMYELGHLYLSGDYIGNNDGLHPSVDCQKHGVHWIALAAQRGSRQAQCELAILYHSGHDLAHVDEDTMVQVIVEQDFEKAYDLFCQAARQGDVTATIYIGTYYEHGIYVAPSVELAKEWYQEAVNPAHSSATHRDDGTNNNDDLENSMLWLAELGLARLWHQEKESVEAYNMFCSAYQHGPPLIDQQTTSSSSHSAMTMCKIMIMRYQLYGWGGVTKNCEKAAQELLQMAETGYFKVFLNVAQCYETGTGLILDHVNAFIWYGRIVAFANSMCNRRADDHSDNTDEEVDDLWDEEGEQDYVLALYKLAEFYRLGYTPNGQKDQEKATSLYYLAADRGSEDARQYVQSFLL
ncbi:hypothetical protein BCR42DRAFT_217316 [Absidia repens]|uniref:HCP-like protein n=1 Tax=Absidia repens TaxID=90262 RepID=A0A1X2IMY1_9FUNG|nr:hypothetical protein BCR42DRAFT_217316 [Absidia repens]